MTTPATKPLVTPEAQVEARALRMLRAGDEPKIVCAATGLSREALARLQRDFPANTPRPPKRCDYAACEALATSVKEGWGFCEAHSVSHEHHKIGAPAETEPVPAAPSPIGRLLEDASAHPVAKVRTLAGRIETALDQLRALIIEHAAAIAAKHAAEEQKATARAEVERLARELAAAKVRLKGAPVAALSPVVRPAPAEKPANGRTALMECRKGCGAQLHGGQGRAAHERRCTAA